MQNFDKKQFLKAYIFLFSYNVFCTILYAAFIKR